ncbi:MAG: sensor histidine kinase, partial [Actinomycetota bacterium]
SPARIVAVAVIGPGIATGVALAAQSIGAVGAASLYLLAVVAVAAAGGVWGGIAAAIFSFLGLNYFFTEPKHTFAVDKLGDVVALLVFLGVAAIVGALFARAVLERARAERRENETRLLNSISNRLLRGGSLQDALDELARLALEMFDLHRCIVDARGPGGRLRAVAEQPTTQPGERVEVPIAAGADELGTIVIERPTEAPALAPHERGLLTALASQAALALERARLDAEARRARLEAETSQVRAALFSSVTHDLRTPLASIKAGVTSLLEQGVVYDAVQQRDLLGAMLEETDRLNRLVGNLLHLARIRAGALVPSKQLVPFDDVVEAVLTRMKNVLGPFTVRTMIRADAPAIWMDPIQMDQVLTNILENAVRYSPAGGEILIAVAPWQDGVQVRIADQGPGIAPQEREHMFEAFVRGSGGGTGLGLSIARAVVIAHDGKIWAEGTPAGGTTIVFQLPLGKPAEAP